MIPKIQDDFGWTLRDLVLDDTAVSDLRLLRGLYQLVEDPGLWGLTFRGCAAARLDVEIARISEIGDPSERARTLFDYLEDWVPQGAQTLGTAADAGADLASAYSRIAGGARGQARRQAHATPSRTISQGVAKIGSGAIKAVLRESYPDLRKRSAHLVSLLQQQRATLAMIPRPNEAEALAEYEAEEEFLRTLEAGLVSIHEEMPDPPTGEISDADADKLRAQLVKLAQLADQAVRHLDQDTGTYGGLYKIGLIAAIGGLLALVPGVTFLTGAVLPTAVLGAQTIRLVVRRDG